MQSVLLAMGGSAAVVLPSCSSWHTLAMPKPVTAALAFASGLALGAVRRRPHAVLLAQCAFLLVTDAHAAPLADIVQILVGVALGFVALEASPPPLVAAYLLACTVSAVNLVDGDGMTPLRAIALTVMVAAPVGIGRYVRARRKAERVARERARDAAEKREAQLRASRMAERARISQELHDIVAHHVGAIVLRANAARYAGTDGPAAEALADIRETGNEVLKDLRGLLRALRDPEAPGDPPPVTDPERVLEDSVARMAAAGLAVTLDADAGAESAPPLVRACAARVVQEGLTNVLKHAGAGTAVHVRLFSGGGTLEVSVTNRAPRGAEPTPLPSSGHGLAGVRERVAVLGGRVSAGPEGGGWRLAASLPYGEAAHGKTAHGETA
jgi:signal transduction histidine kinase